MSQLDLMGMPIPEEYGGAGLDYHAYAGALEEISRGSGGLGTIVAAHISLACNMVYEFGDEGQKQEYLTPLAKGDDIGAFALSEAGAGSDVPAMGTTAERDGDEYVINGSKLWISNGSVADTITVFVKTDPDAGDRGISSFIVRPAEDEGFIVEGTEDKLGDMDTKTRAARLLMHDAADKKIRGESYVKEAAQAKLYASEVSREVANEGIQIHGGYGYVKDFPVERFYRDAKLNEIYEGTREILRNTIADQLLD